MIPPIADNLFYLDSNAMPDIEDSTAILDELARPFLRDNMSKEEKSFILEAIQKLPSEEREDIIARALPLMRDDMSGKKKARILEKIQEIPHEEREDVINLALSLMSDDTSPDHKIYILNAIQRIPSEEKNDVKQRALLLITSNMSGVEKVKILEAIRVIPSKEREDVIQHALFFIASNMSGEEKAKILRAVQEIPSEERDDVIQRSLRLMQDHLTSNQKASILKMIREIPSQERDDVIQQALLPLINHGMTEDLKVLTLKIFQQIPSQERRDFVEQTLPLLQNDMKKWDIIPLLETVQKIPFEERRDVIERALPLLQSNTCRWSKTHTLNSVRNIPPEERADVIQLALSLVKDDDIAAYNDLPLLEAIQKIPLAERNSKEIQTLVYWHAKNLFDYNCLYGFVLNKKGKLHDFLHNFTNLNGRNLNFTLPRMFSIISYQNTINEFIESQKHELLSTEFEFLQNYSANIHRALNIFKEHCIGIAAAEKIYQEIQKLSPGELYSIASGWRDHAVMYNIIREEQGFTLTIINTGDDEKNAVQRKNSTEPENDYAISGRYPHKGYKIDHISIKLIQHLMSPATIRGDKMLELIDAACKELNAKEQNGRLHKIQLRGNCLQKCLTSSFKGECLRQLGLNAGNYLYERFRLYHSVKLEARIDQIEKNVPVHEIMEIYKVTTEQELQLCIAERKQAVEEQINHRREKVRTLVSIN